MSKFGDSITTVERERDLRVEAGAMEGAARTNCCLILIHLKCGKMDAAKSVHSNGYKSISNYDSTDGCIIMDDLFAAIGSNSLEDFTACIKHPYFRGLENDYVKLLRNMEMPEGGANNIDFNADPGSSATFPDFNQAGETPNLNDEPDFC